MTSLDKLKLNRNTPTTVIYSGANYIGVELAKTLIEQKGFVIVIDDLSEDKVSAVSEIYDNESFLFVDKTGLVELKDELYSLDYFIYINCLEDNPLIKISSQDFLEMSNTLSSLIKLCLKFKSKFVYVDSIEINQYLLTLNADNLPEVKKNVLNYNVSEFQRYSESLVIEYTQKVNLNGRVVRVGEIIGAGVPLNSQSEVIKLAKLAATQKDIKLSGDGLNLKYLVSLQDAVYGVLKSLFEEKTKGNIYSLCYPQEITTLSLAYKLSEIEPKSGQILFDEDFSNTTIPLTDNTKNLTSIGWEPKVTLERALTQLLEWINTGSKDQKKNKKDIPVVKPLVREEKAPISQKKDKNGEFVTKLAVLSRSKSRNSKIVLSDKQLRDKINQQNAKLNNGHNRKDFGYKVKFFFKTLTLRKIFNYSILLLLLFFLYFFLISPIARNSKSVFDLYTLSKIETTYTDPQNDMILEDTESVINDVTNSKIIFETFRLDNLKEGILASFGFTNQYALTNKGIRETSNPTKEFFLSKTMLENTLTDFNSSYIDQMGKLLELDSSKYKLNIAQMDAALERIRTNIKTNDFIPFNSYINFKSINPIFNFNEGQNIFFLVNDDTKKIGVNNVYYFNYINFSTTGYQSSKSGNYTNEIKPTREMQNNLEVLIKNSADKKTLDENFYQYIASLETIIGEKIDTLVIVDQTYLPTLIGAGTIEINNEQMDSVEVTKQLNSSKLEDKYEINSSIILNYLTRQVKFDELSSYLNLFLNGQLTKKIDLFTFIAN